MSLASKLGVLVLSSLLTLGGCGGSTNGASGGAGGSGGDSGGTGGGTGANGGGGTGGSTPITPTDKVDLLLMLDNSISMSDKQQLLKEAVPRLLNGLVNPPAGGKPVTDLHIGIITSSLGGHGGNQCSPASLSFNPAQNDRAHLLPSVRSQLPSYQNLGFLWWDPGNTAGGETDLSNLISQFGQQVVSSGENGCGFEASLEAWYRFLVDPAPPQDVVVNNNVAETSGIDDVVLQQRKDFLRPDSAVAIVMLSDENDCSIMDGGMNWLASQLVNPNNTMFHLPRATSACTTDPNGPCCRSCAASESSPPAGCASLQNDPGCQAGGGVWDDLGDHPNLRCWQQKKRFGIDFLYPTRKYAEALTQPTICSSWVSTTTTSKGECTGTRVPNPLFADGRDPRLVFLTGIVGVPWQDLATPATLTDPDNLELMTSSELSAQGRWSWLLPECQEEVPAAELPNPRPICKTWKLGDDPDDPLMIESISPRSGANPATKEPIADPNAPYQANSINGHEWNTEQSDLQYACIFQRATPLDCSATGGGCDCADVSGGYSANNPLCQSPSGYSFSQGFAKAYPGTRHLEVLRDLGDQAIVASICAKSLTGSGSGYGYNAAMDALVKRLAPVLK